MKKIYRVFSVNPQQIAQLLPVEDDGTGTLKVSVDSEHLSKFKVGSEVTVEFS